ncbi:MAG: FtsX-like permease family protein [Sphingobacteriia bacterium]|jgi:lipoprotein-releasing system permease protein
MNLPLRIASRYLLSRRLPGPVNVISWIAMLGVMLGTAALVILLSVFNGFSTLIRDVFQDFDPVLKVAPAEGQYLANQASLMQQLAQHPGVAAVVPSLEGRALLRYHDRQRVIRLKGVPENNIGQVSRVAERLAFGSFRLRTGRDPAGIIAGSGVAYALNAGLEDYRYQMELIAVSASANLTMADEERALNRRQVVMTGVFSLQKEYDDQYVLAPLPLVQGLFEAEGQVSALELAIGPGADAEALEAELQARLGPAYQVLNAYEQHATLYEVMKSEKAVGFLLITLMLMLYCTNIVGSLSMVVIEKKRDIGILQVMGAGPGLIRRIFLTSGLWMGALGGGTGLLLGYGLSWLQEYGQVVPFPGATDNLIISHYPIETRLSDALYIALTVLALALLSAWYPARRAGRSHVLQNLQG